MARVAAEQAARREDDVTPGSAADRLMADIVGRVRAGTWLDGCRLPTERMLAAQFGVDRSVVRRVMADLKKRDVVRQTVGSGTYVCDGAATRLIAERDEATALPDCSPSELMVARLVVEPAICELVIHNATSADFVAIEACCANAERATPEHFDVWNNRLHRAIADAAHNSFIDNLYRMIAQVQADTAWGALKRDNHTPELIAVYNRQHRELVSALKDRNAVEAGKHIRAHLAFARRNLLGL